ncbi:MAG TPA: FkbM family methyltransferase [Vicinamibacterales bacterium]|nr:FkbM family methyltransferase [Vicinamibacterales bacterium]
MELRQCVHAAGRVLTRVLLHPGWRDAPPAAWTYLHLYLLGKRLTERRELALLRSLIEPGMTIADVGANTGFYTLHMAASVGRAGRILAFEPDPYSHQLLERRVRQRKLSNIRVYRLALGEQPGRATLYCSAFNRADNRLSQSHDEPHVEACDVEVRTLDDVLSELGVPAVDAMKIDVQGNEAHVLRGAERTLRGGFRWLWLEFSPQHLRAAGSNPERFLRDLDASGLRLLEVSAEGRLEAVTDHRALVDRLGQGYGDLVVMPREARMPTTPPVQVGTS